MCVTLQIDWNALAELLNISTCDAVIVGGYYEYQVLLQLRQATISCSFDLTLTGANGSVSWPLIHPSGLVTLPAYG